MCENPQAYYYVESKNLQVHDKGKDFDRAKTSMKLIDETRLVQTCILIMAHIYVLMDSRMAGKIAGIGRHWRVEGVKGHTIT